MEGYFQSHGGGLLAEAAAYIARVQVAQLLSAIRAGEFCYVLTPRQMGKTTLKNAVVAELNKSAGPDRIHPVSVDLDRIGAPGALPVDPNQATASFYYGLLDAIADGLNLPLDFPRWWQEQSNLSFVQRLSKFLRTVVLEEIPSGSIVIFVDEIGTIRSLGADADSFFAAIRALYNARGDDPVFRRLTFVLLGTATPSDLIQDPARTPFNLGRRIELRDFALEEVAPWRVYLETQVPGQGASILSAVFEWTNGHPALTQRLCAAIDGSRHHVWSGQRVHDWVENTVLPQMKKELRSEPALGHIQRAIETLPDQERKAILKMYREIHENFGRRGVRTDTVSSEQEYLKMLGLVREENGFLHVRNKIYYQVFDETWVRSQMPAHLPTDLAVNLSANPLAVGLITFFIVTLCASAILLRGGLFDRSDEGAPSRTSAPAPTDPPAVTAAQLLSLTKSGVGTISPGETITYTLIIRNPGGDALEDIAVHDTFDSYTVLYPTIISPPDGVVEGGNVIVWKSLSLAPGETKELRWQGMVAPDIPLGTAENPTVISQEATLTRGGQLVTSVPSRTQVVPRGISLLSQASPEEVSPGETINYVLTVYNSGPLAVRSVVVTDTISPDINRVIPDGTHGAVVTGKHINWILDELTPGQTVKLRWQGQVDLHTASKTIINGASLTIMTDGSPREQADASQTTVRQPVLSLSKRAPVRASPGETIVYTIIIENSGGYQASDLIVTDGIPAGVLNPGNIQEGGILDTVAQNITWKIPHLLPDEQRALSWQGQVDPDIDLTSSSVVQIGGMAVALGSPGGETITATVSTSLGARPLKLTKTASSSAFPGGAIGITLTVENVSDTSLYGFQIRDTVPTCIVSPNIIRPSGGFEGSNIILWSLDSLEPGGIATFEWQGVVCTDAQVGQIASLSRLTVEGILQEEASTSTPVEPKLSLSSGATGQAGPGQSVSFNLTVKALGSVQGTVSAPAVVVRATIPDYVDVDPAAINRNGAIDGDAVTWRLGDLAKDAVLDLRWSGTIDPSIPPAETAVTSRARLTNASGQRADAEATIRLLAQSIGLSGSAPDSLWPGHIAPYLLQVHNNSSSTQYQVEVRNPLPAYVVSPGNISLNGRLEDATIVWVIESVRPNDTVDLRWQGTVDPAVPASQTTIQNQATLRTASGLTDETTSNSPLIFPALTLSKLATAQAGPGGTVAYTLTIKNTGSAPALGVALRDGIPDFLVVNSVDIGQGGAIEGRSVIWNFGELAAGQQRELTWRGKLELGIPANIDAVSSPATLSSNRGLVAQTGASTALLHPAIELSKGAPTVAAPGQVLTYTLLLLNTGDLILTDIVIVDTLPTQVFSPTTASVCGGTRQADTITWKIPLLVKNQSILIQCGLRVDPTLSGVTSITNQASVTAWPGVQDYVSASTIISGALSSTIGPPLLALMPTIPSGFGHIDR